MNLPERLRNVRSYIQARRVKTIEVSQTAKFWDDCEEAADRIEALQAENERLRAIQDAAWNYMYACEQSRGEAVELLALSDALEKAAEAKEKSDD